MDRERKRDKQTDRRERERMKERDGWIKREEEMQESCDGRTSATIVGQTDKTTVDIW